MRALQPCGPPWRKGVRGRRGHPARCVLHAAVFGRDHPHLAKAESGVATPHLGRATGSCPEACGKSERVFRWLRSSLLRKPSLSRHRGAKRRGYPPASLVGGRLEALVSRRHSSVHDPHHDRNHGHQPPTTIPAPPHTQSPAGNLDAARQRQRPLCAQGSFRSRNMRHRCGSSRRNLGSG
jgi:hypothetical protein